MIETALTILLWACALGSGLIAGVFFAFSAFIMAALGRIPYPRGISAMQAINETILGSAFMPVFFGTALAALILAGAAPYRWDQPGAAATLAAGIVYVAGMFLCTVFFNVPLNNRLAAVDAEDLETAQVWETYLRKWTLWNHVRTVASTLACGLYVAAIAF